MHTSVCTCTCRYTKSPTAIACVAAYTCRCMHVSACIWPNVRKYSCCKLHASLHVHTDVGAVSLCTCKCMHMSMHDVLACITALKWRCIHANACAASICIAAHRVMHAQEHACLHVNAQWCMCCDCMHCCTEMHAHRCMRL